MPSRKKSIPRHIDVFTPRERLFVAAYISNGFVYGKACQQAGYKNKDHYKYGWEIGNKPHIKREIERKMNELVDKIGFTHEYTLRKLKLGVDRAIPDDESMESDIKSGVSCISERNKMVGAYAKIEEEKENPLDKMREDIEGIEKKAVESE